MENSDQFPTAQSFYIFLRAAIEDGGMGYFARLREIAAGNRDLLIKGPAIAALTCWGDVGFAAIIEKALRNQTSKDTSAALKTLAIIASGKLLSSGITFLHDDELSRVISNYRRTRRSIKPCNASS